MSKLNKGLVLHMPLSQSWSKSATIATDKTPYENDGVIYGATYTADRHGQPNSAMSFDGVDDYIDCGNDESLKIIDDITLSLWLKPNQLDNIRRRRIIAPSECPIAITLSPPA